MCCISESVNWTFLSSWILSQVKSLVAPCTPDDERVSRQGLWGWRNPMLWEKDKQVFREGMSRYRISWDVKTKRDSYKSRISTFWSLSSRLSWICLLLRVWAPTKEYFQMRKRKSYLRISFLQRILPHILSEEHAERILKGRRDRCWAWCRSSRPRSVDLRRSLCGARVLSGSR